MADKENNQDLPPEDATVVESVSPADESDAQDSDSATDEPVDDLDDDDNLDEEEIISLKDKVINFLQEKAPFVYSFYLKLTKQENSEENEGLEEDDAQEVEDEQDDAVEEAEQTGVSQQGLVGKVDETLKGFRDKLFAQMPFLKQFALKLNQKSTKKNKRPRKKILSQKMTYLIIVGLIAWLLFDEGFNPENGKKIKPQAPTTAQVIDKQNQQADTEEKTIPTEEVDPQQPPHEVTTSENSDVPITTEVEPLPVEITTASEENTSNENAAVAISDTEPTSAETSTSTEETTATENTEDNVAPIATDINTSPSVATEDTPESIKDLDSKQVSNNSDISKNPQLSEDTPGQEPIGATTKQPGKVEIEKTKDLDTEIRDIIEKVEEKYADKEDYESAPDYTKVGRGLVYNCKNKHWSCLNRTNYHQCRKNQIFFTKLKNLPECVVFDVYYSDEDCQIKQADMINKLIPVPACTEQTDQPLENSRKE